MSSKSIDLPTNKVKIDPTNPRIAHLEHQAESEDGVMLSLSESTDIGIEEDAENSSTKKERTTYSKLRASIRAHKRVIQPIHVKKEPNGELICIEGNTRLAIYKNFLASREPGDWSKIPSILYDGISQNEVDAIRLQAHLVGPRPWSPYAKARYLHVLRLQEDMNWEEIVDFAGGNVSEIKKQIQAYTDMEEHYRRIVPSDDEFDTKKFSGFKEFQDRQLDVMLSKANFTKQDFARWIHENKLKPLNTIRRLPEIFDNPQAREIFLAEGGTAKDAIRHIEKSQGTEPGLDNIALDRIARHLRIKLSSMDPEAYQKLQEGEDPILRDELDQLVETLENILNY